MDNKKKNKLMIIMVVVAFLSPIVLSWWYVNFTNVIEEGGKSNHGDLIDPPRPINNLDLYEPIAERQYELHGKWNLVYIANDCNKACVENLYRMRQLHLTMDKHSLRVQRVLLLSDPTQQDLKSLFAEYVGQRVVQFSEQSFDDLLSIFKLNESDEPVEANRLYIVDPLGNLMMSYPPDINPRGIMLDLKKLLKTSRIG